MVSFRVKVYTELLYYKLICEHLRAKVVYYHILPLPYFAIKYKMRVVKSIFQNGTVLAGHCPTGLLLQSTSRDPNLTKIMFQTKPSSSWATVVKHNRYTSTQQTYQILMKVLQSIISTKLSKMANYTITTRSVLFFTKQSSVPTTQAKEYSSSEKQLLEKLIKVKNPAYLNLFQANFIKKFSV